MEYSTIWSEDFTDDWARNALKEWVTTGKITHDTSHVRALESASLPADEAALGRSLAAELQRNGAIMGIFDEGCMGMYNAIIPDELLNPVGVYKERLSQSALYYETTEVSDASTAEMDRVVVVRQLADTLDSMGTALQLLARHLNHIAAPEVAETEGDTLQR